MSPEVTTAVEAAGLPVTSVNQLFLAITNATAAGINAVPGITPDIVAVFRDAQETVYATSLGDVYLTSIAFGVIALISVFFVKDDIESNFTNFLNKTVSGAVPAPKTEEKVKRNEIKYGLESFLFHAEVARDNTNANTFFR
jgi:translation elongation factor EF-1beta